MWVNIPIEPFVRLTTGSGFAKCDAVGRTAGPTAILAPCADRARKLHLYPGTVAVGSRADRHGCVVQLGDLIDDGKPQAAAVPRRIGQSIKPLQYAVPVRFRDSGSGVFHGEAGSAVFLAGADGYAAAGRGVFQGVVDQIAEEIVDERGVRED